ncbi:hypothetical protein M9H77_19712 [Catharanthus roseus]|uniref:Uncharacterized protein n=1 Tax=Catharanthus roseus TaxID=4058 RepID=A0ACC0BB11_CATRO|nr:hypothetical protein M9H77_19712 [Catharanthus roseus]
MKVTTSQKAKRRRGATDTVSRDEERKKKREKQVVDSMRIGNPIDLAYNISLRCQDHSFKFSQVLQFLLPNYLISSHPNRFQHNNHEVVKEFILSVLWDLKALVLVEDAAIQPLSYVPISAKSLVLRALTRQPDAHVEDVNHGDSTVLQTGGQDLVRTRNYLPHWRD